MLGHAGEPHTALTALHCQYALCGLPDAVTSDANLHRKAGTTWCSSAHDRRRGFVLADCSKAESPGPSAPVACPAPDAWLSRDAERLGTRRQQIQYKFNAHSCCDMQRCPRGRPAPDMFHNCTHATCHCRPTDMSWHTAAALLTCCAAMIGTRSAGSCGGSCGVMASCCWVWMRLNCLQRTLSSPTLACPAAATAGPCGTTFVMYSAHIHA